MATYEDFQKLDIRIGKVVAIEDYPEAKNPSYKLQIDFGDEIGIKKSIAHLVPNYSKEELLGKLIAGVVNFPPRQIGKSVSEVLTLGFPDTDGKAVLFSPDKEVVIGSKLF